MSFPPPLTEMRQDMSALIIDWGVTCTIKRKSSSSRNAAGQVSAAFSTVGTETMWIQPIDAASMNKSGIKDPGIIDNTTHQAFARYAGSETQNQDQILAAGDTYAYDVLSSQLLSTHRVIFLQKVKRS